MNNVDVSFSLHTANGQTLMVLRSPHSGKKHTVAAENDAFRCRISRLPPTVGGYRVGRRILIGGDESDWPRDGIGLLKVAGGDFFGTGNVGFGATAPALIDGFWI